MRSISASTLSIGFCLYRRVSRIELAQNSHRSGQPRLVCTASRLYFVGLEQVEGRHRRLGQREIGRGPGSIGWSRPASASCKTSSQTGSPSPMTTASACRPASSGSAVTCSPPITTGTPDCPVAVGQIVRFVDLGTEARDRHQVEAVGEPVELPDVLDFVILATVPWRSHARQGEQPQARQRRDHLAALHEARQRHAEPQQLGITRPHAAHCDQADFHRQSPCTRKSHVATIRDATGKKEEPPERRPPSREEADRGMATAPIKKPAEATGGGSEQMQVLRRQRERQVQEAGAEERDMAQAHHPPAPRSVSAHPVRVMEKQPDHGPRDEAGQDRSQAARKFKSCIESASLPYHVRETLTPCHDERRLRSNR